MTNGLLSITPLLPSHKGNFNRKTLLLRGTQRPTSSATSPDGLQLCSGRTTAVRADLCLAINATITPSPFTVAQEGQNVTLTCVVSQRRRNSALPVVKWTFLPAGTERPEDELLIARVNMRKARFYGNYTKSFTWPKMKLTVVKHGKVFELLILNVSEDDRGLYLCRVQEFRKHQDRWRAASNCTAATELRVHVLPAAKEKESLWSLFEDVYLCAVLICSIGLLCMCMFTVTITCQFIQRKRRLKDSYLLKSPHNSSGETVTSEANVSPALPKKERRYRKKRSKGLQEELPPEIPAKAPIKSSKPKLLKPQPRKVLLPRIVEENLTYAELELIKPLPEMKAACSGTVYAQILFKEQKL
ncbi:V-set and transmembrane domain-containing protein 4 isoform X2 [Oryzias melastigma]|uniref:V-set and transmembrane domain containing 4b n=1 Tax=Oryzias melastigma TaxID=30732 RepID=A0A3B3BRY1_ORYME|nr:V-set and transmembrane domain-containing protein 4 isoform X2 [Oryzias melastigma]